MEEALLRKLEMLAEEFADLPLATVVNAVRLSRSSADETSPDAVVARARRRLLALIRTDRPRLA